MKTKRKAKMVLILVPSTIIAFVLLMYGAVSLFINSDDCYSPYETYENVTVCTTRDEVRIDDTNNNSGSILVHNVLLYGNIGGYLYIIDKNNNKIVINIYTKELRRILSDDELSEQDQINFDAVSSYQYEDFRYIYEKS